MERKLYRFIMTPSAIITLILGLGLMHSFKISWSALPFWLAIKLLLVALLIGFSSLLWQDNQAFSLGKNPHSAKFYRFFNEFPTLILIATVLLVVHKPM
jgi:protoporphyrinogen IX oxidase